MLLERKQNLIKTLAVLLASLPTTAWAADSAGKPSATNGEEQPAEEQPVGFLLGDFYLKDFRPIQGVKTKLMFTVHAAVKAEMSDSFDNRLERRQKRVRDQIITAMRLAEPEEFQDPELRLIRRRLFLRLKRALPDLPIEEVYFSKFRYFVEE